MKSKSIITILISAAFVAIVVLLATGESKRSTDENKITVGATIFPVYDIARNIGGDNVNVMQIVPSGASPHTYEVTPDTIEQLAQAKTIFAIGHGADSWTDTITQSLDNIRVMIVDNNITLLPFSQHHQHDHEQEEHEHEHEHDHEQEEHEHEHDHEQEEHEHEGEHDPHYWLSVTNARLIAATIANELAALDPDHSADYQENLNSYQSKLDTLLTASHAKLATLDNKNIVATHGAWQYFCDEFDLETVGVFQASPGREPTPQELAALQEIVETYDIRALFSEPQLSDEVVRPFADDTGLPIYDLDPLGGTDNRQSYVELIQYNVNTIYNALRQ